jgi:hypothetical protein
MLAVDDDNLQLGNLHQNAVHLVTDASLGVEGHPLGFPDDDLTGRQRSYPLVVRLDSANLGNADLVYSGAQRLEQLVCGCACYLEALHLLLNLLHPYMPTLSLWPPNPPRSIAEHSFVFPRAKDKAKQVVTGASTPVKEAWTREREWRSARPEILEKHAHQ